MSILKFHTIDEVSAILRQHRETTRRMIASGQIEGTPVGQGKKRQRWLVSQAALEAYVQKRNALARPVSASRRVSCPSPAKRFI